jgi:prepilin-type N-terminal cleavage/methylation domain-containing protein
MRLYTNKQRGVTLVEILVVTGIGLLLMLGIYQFAANTLQYRNEFGGRLQLLDDVRQIMRPMASVIRQAQDSSVGDYAIEEAASTTLTVYSDIIDNPYRERVRYFVEEAELKRGVLTPSGQPLVYDEADEEIEVLMRNISNVTFLYYGEEYRGTTSALIHPFPVSDVRMVEVIITIDDDPNREPNPLGEVSMFVQLRNLKNNL